MTKPTDVRPVAAALYFLPIKTRMPLKFGPEITTEVTCARIRVTVADAQGRRAEGWGETPLSVQWVWPSPLGYEERHQVLRKLTARIAEAWIDAPGEAGPSRSRWATGSSRRCCPACSTSSTTPSGRAPSRSPGWRRSSAPRPSTWPCTTPTACSTACRPTRPITPGS